MMSRSCLFWIQVSLVCFVLVLNGSVAMFGQNFQVKYKVQSQRDSTNADFKREETATLFIENKANSYFYTDHFAAKDSMMKLVNSGKVSVYEVMSDKGNLKLTQFNQHITKDVSKNRIHFFEKIFTSVYSYSFQPSFKWEIQSDTQTIKGYLCYKATGYFGGRTYIAWFTQEIPVADGPYVFCGLPGLIVKVHDDKNHYDFTLASLEQTTSSSFLKVPSTSEKIIKASREQVFKARERMRIQSLDVMREMGFDIVKTPDIQEKLRQKQKTDNNPLELRVD
ncbi:MAG: GLPGLI family protein [Spirosomataceae bacterium]